MCGLKVNAFISHSVRFLINLGTSEVVGEMTAIECEQDTTLSEHVIATDVFL
jgi:hypothetical protein